MTKYDVFVNSKIVAVNRVERLKQFEIYKIKKKNAPTTNRSVLGGPHMLSTTDRYSAIICAYRNKYNIFVGHMSEIITFAIFILESSSQRLAEVKGGI